MLEKLDELTSNIGDMALKRRVEKIISELDVKHGEIVLDSGCGDGLYLKTLRELGAYKIFGYDLEERSLRLAQYNINRTVPVTCGNICALPFADNTFDKIYCTEVVEHVPEDRKALSELYRVLKPKGVLIVTVPNHNYPFLWDPLNWFMESIGIGYVKSGFWAGIWNMHLRLYYPDEIKEIISSAGFEIRETAALTHYCVPFNHIILYGLKKVLDSGLLPEKMKNTADKFSVKEGKQSGIIKFGYYILNLFDKLNNGISENKSSASVFVKAVKK